MRIQQNHLHDHLDAEGAVDHVAVILLFIGCDADGQRGVPRNLPIRIAILQAHVQQSGDNTRMLAS